MKESHLKAHWVTIISFVKLFSTLFGQYENHCLHSKIFVVICFCLDFLSFAS